MLDRPITWIRVGDRYPDMAGERDHFLALDGEIVVGVVKLMTAGADTGRWLWSVTILAPGPAFNRPRNGTCETRGEAGRELVAAWQAFRKYYGLEE